MMTQSLEKILFDMNDGLHRAGVIADEKYITQESLLFALIATLILNPLFMRVIESKIYDKYFIFFMSVVLMILIYMMAGFFPILLVIIIVGFIDIIYKYPKYRSIKEFIDRLF